MLFGTKKRPVSDFLPRVLAHIDGIDSNMVSTYIMDAVIQFIRDTKVLTEIQCITLEPCIESYKLHSDNYITEILEVRFFANGKLLDRTMFSYRVDNGTLYVAPSCICDKVTVEVEFCVTPSRDSDEVPDFIYEEWVDAITALTLSKLYLLTDNQWYNQAASNNQLSIYQQLCRQARISRITKHKPLNIRLALP